MKSCWILWSLLLLCTAPAAQAQELDAYRWKFRLLLAASPSGDSALFREQQRLLRPSDAEALARDLLLLPLSPLSHPGTYERLGLAPDTRCILLIGKDGGEKYRSTSPVAPEALFRIIDAMPMRQAEMRHP
jgi:hypothetical protein